MSLEDVGRAHCLGNHGSASNDAQVLALIFVTGSQPGLERVGKVSRLGAQPNHVRFAEDKGRFLIRDHRRGLAGKANVLWTHMLQQQVIRGLARLHRIAGHDH